MPDPKRSPDGPASAPAATPETLAAIVAEMREAGRSGEHADGPIIEDYADRIEAAAERERAVDEDTSDGYHTFRELYRYRMLYNAAFFNMIARHTNIPVVKSHRHGDGEPCFGGGWFIVMAQLPTGQVSNHYEDRFWELFHVPEAEKAPEWDGHTPNDAADRLESFLEMRETDSDESNPPGNAAAMREALSAELERLRAERDRLRDIVRNAVETLEQVYKHADMTDALREVVAETQREARAAIGEDAK